MMRIKTSLLLTFVLVASVPLTAQESESAPAPEEETTEEAAASPTPAPAVVNPAEVLARWEKANGNKNFPTPRRWLFLQEQGGAYGAPSPLAIDKFGFENHGWLQLADAEAIRLFVQLNPSLKSDTVKPEELPARLKRYALLTRSQAIVMRTAATPPSWVVYANTRDVSAPQFLFDKGPETLRSDVPARWLVQKLGYDATVVGVIDDYLVLAKMRPVRAGSQGLILRRSTKAIVSDNEKDVGALLRVVHQGDDYLLAKVLLAKSGKSKVPVGSKVLFDEP